MVGEMVYVTPAPATCVRPGPVPTCPPFSASPPISPRAEGSMMVEGELL